MKHESEECIKFEQKENIWWNIRRIIPSSTAYDPAPPCSRQMWLSWNDTNIFQLMNVTLSACQSHNVILSLLSQDMLRMTPSEDILFDQNIINLCRLALAFKE